MDLQTIYSRYLECTAPVIDSREVEKGCMFFALRGENFNGNRFAVEAIQKGARYALVDDPVFANSRGCILVKDTLEVMQKLANLHRKNLPVQVLAITGSNGKTTTKELIYGIMASEHPILATQKNYNNHIGVPLTLLRLTPHHNYAVVEMGANHSGEIRMLCKIADPDFGIITNIGKAHLEGFGSFEGVIKAKSELYDHICSREGIIFYNSDNKLLQDLLNDRSCRTYDYGTSPQAFCSGSIIRHTPFLEIQSNELKLKTRLIGDYNFENLMAALCVARYTGISKESVHKAIYNYIPDNNRSQIIQTNTNEIILDAYNANPTSMKAALENFARLERKNKTLILGDMFELGTYSLQEHRQIIETLQSMKFHHVFLIGDHFFTQAGNTIDAFRQTEEFMKWLKNHPIRNSSILIKGSRGMALEKLVEML